MPKPIPKEETRTLAEIQAQYQLERHWAEKIKLAPQQQRKGLYSQAYQSLNQVISNNPQLTKKTKATQRKQTLALQFALLNPFLNSASSFLEIGAGDCTLACELSKSVSKVIAVEASHESVKGVKIPSNLDLLICDDFELPLQDSSIDLAFTCHVIEHFHPQDALIHLNEMRRILKPGGKYICITPNSLYGPHDVSKYFDDSPCGLHLKEYSFSTLGAAFRKSGFRTIRRLKGIGTAAEPCRLWKTMIVEKSLGLIPAKLRERLLTDAGYREPFRPLEQVILCAEKQ